MLWEMTSGIIQRSWLASGYTLTRQSTELVVGFHTFPHEDGLSHAGMKLDHGFLAVGHGTVPLHAHLKLHHVPFSWWHCRFSRMLPETLTQFFPRFHSTRLGVLTASRGANIGHGSLVVGMDTDAGSFGRQ